MLLVSLFVSFSLAAPIILVASWRDPSMPTFMKVPETTVNKNYFASRKKDKVRLSWEVLVMERVTITQSVSRLSDTHLRNRVLAAHGTHTGASLFCREVVSHQAAPQKPVSGK